MMRLADCTNLAKGGVSTVCDRVSCMYLSGGGGGGGGEEIIPPPSQSFAGHDCHYCQAQHKVLHAAQSLELILPCQLIGLLDYQSLSSRLASKSLLRRKAKGDYLSSTHREAGSLIKLLLRLMHVSILEMWNFRSGVLRHGPSYDCHCSVSHFYECLTFL